MAIESENRHQILIIFDCPSYSYLERGRESRFQEKGYIKWYGNKRLIIFSICFEGEMSLNLNSLWIKQLR